MKFLHFAFAGAGAWSGLSNRKGSLRHTANVNVGGLTYTICDEDVSKYPTSNLYQLIDSAEDSNEIMINRSGTLFRWIYAYMINGQLPKDRHGKSALDKTTLQDLMSEANFYGLTNLEEECDNEIKRKSAPDLASFLDLRKYFLTVGCDRQEVEYASDLITAMQEITSPFCVFGDIDADALPGPIYGNSTIRNIDLGELLATAEQSPFGNGTETVVDTNVRDSFEIKASSLNEKTTNLIASKLPFKELAPHLNLTLRPYKLVIYKEGGHFDAHRDTVRGDGHIGTLVVILNSTYTGGELEVTHGGRTEVVTGPYSWVAMYGDCLHKINPVTSGTRVSLIYDIYGTEPAEDSVSVNEFFGMDADVCSYGNAAEWYALDSHCKPSNDSVWNALSPTEKLKEMFWKRLEQELIGYESVIVCLQHLYPEGQTITSFFKGLDRVLLDLIKETGAYEVEVVMVTIYLNFLKEYDDDQIYENFTECSLFSSTIVKRAMGILPKEPIVKEKSKLILTTHLHDDALLDYFPYDMCYEDSAGERVYLVTGLQLRRKKD